MGRTALLLGVLVAVLAGLALVLPRPGPAERALKDHISVPDGPDSAYPRLGTTMRARGWLESSPWLIEGNDIFVKLPDLRLAAPRVLTARDLRAGFTLIAGSTWNNARQAWVRPDGSEITLAQVRETLEAAAAAPGDARFLLELLIGVPAAHGSTLRERLARGELPEVVRFQGFSGAAGRMLRDPGRPPYQEVQRQYEGIVVAFEGAGWPVGWRVGRLVATGR